MLSLVLLVTIAAVAVLVLLVGFCLIVADLASALWPVWVAARKWLRLRRRWLPFLTVLLLALPAQAVDDRLWRDRFRVFPIAAHYGLNYYGHAFMAALYLAENGPTDNPLGYNNPDNERDVCPCVAANDRKIARATMAILRGMQTYLMSDAYRRREFTRWFARYYHAAPTVDANDEYAKQLRGTWPRAVNWLAAHGLDRMRTSDLRPFAAECWSSSVWRP